MQRTMSHVRVVRAAIPRYCPMTEYLFGLSGAIPVGKGLSNQQDRRSEACVEKRDIRRDHGRLGSSEYSVRHGTIKSRAVRCALRILSVPDPGRSNHWRQLPGARHRVSTTTRTMLAEPRRRVVVIVGDHDCLRSRSNMIGERGFHSSAWLPLRTRSPAAPSKEDHQKDNEAFHRLLMAHTVTYTQPQSQNIPPNRLLASVRPIGARKLPQPT